MNIDIQTIYDKICTIEKELASVKHMLDGEINNSKPNTVSLKGLAKALVSDEELDQAITKAKRSLFHGVGNELY